MILYREIHKHFCVVCARYNRFSYRWKEWDKRAEWERGRWSLTLVIQLQCESLISSFCSACGILRRILLNYFSFLSCKMVWITFSLCFFVCLFIFIMVCFRCTVCCFNCWCFWCCCCCWFEWKLRLCVANCSHLLSTMSYLDETRVGIWGWGYGGYVTAMVLGAQQPVYKCGVSVSPITDWLFYSKYKFQSQFFFA